MKENYTKICLFFFLNVIVILTACGDNAANNNEDMSLPVVSNNGVSLQAYPSVDDSYPVPPSNIDSVLNADLPPAEFPEFPGKIAFQTERFDGNLQVAVLDGDTGAISRIVQNFPATFEPTWSPDCSKLVFTVGQGADNDFDLYMQDLSDESPTLFISHSGFYDWGANWSSSNGVIAYQINQDALINICFTDSMGNEIGCMERGDFSNAMPAWSPDGSQLVFSSNREGNWEIYIIDYPEMTTLAQLTKNSFIDFSPVFSPDGSTILFTSQRGADYNLFTIQPDGREEKQITSDGADERDPTWVGETLIAYTAGFQEEMELYLIGADGNNPQRLTYSPGLDEWPVWCAP